MASRITLKSVNEELARRGIQALLEKGPGYFYFRTGESADWLDRTVNAPALNTLTLEQWVEEFHRLKKVNERIMGSLEAPAPATTASKRAPGKGAPGTVRKPRA